MTQKVKNSSKQEQLRIFALLFGIIVIVLVGLGMKPVLDPDGPSSIPQLPIQMPERINDLIGEEAGERTIYEESVIGSYEDTRLLLLLDGEESHPLVRNFPLWAWDLSFDCRYVAAFGSVEDTSVVFIIDLMEHQEEDAYQQLIVPLDYEATEIIFSEWFLAVKLMPPDSTDPWLIRFYNVGEWNVAKEVRFDTPISFGGWEDVADLLLVHNDQYGTPRYFAINPYDGLVGEIGFDGFTNNRLQRESNQVMDVLSSRTCILQ